jgi:uncharacterized repeat protein (TIGR03806 family)
MWLLLAGCEPDSTPTHDSSPPADEPASGLDARLPNPTCVAPAPPPSEVHLERVFDWVQLEEPTTTAEQAPGDPTHWYVLEQAGRVRRFSTTPGSPVTTVLDHRDVVEFPPDGGEPGLLSIAFHPAFAENGQVFLTYTAIDPDTGGLVARLSRFTSPDGGATLPPQSEEVLFTLVKRWPNHHGGNIGFGPDGMLYVGWGDGGSEGDRDNVSQNLFQPFGKVMRLDVDHPERGLPYGIPADNPFAEGGGLPEIWAWGFRNPWRWSFDPVTGDLWAGDVGMHTYEEIDLVERGNNYGWRLKEAVFCNEPAVDCDPEGLTTDPVVWYAREYGHAVIGGHVYRGEALPGLYGTYLFNDYGGDSVYAITTDPDTGGGALSPVAEGSNDIVDWAYGLDGESYLLSLHGELYRLAPPDDPGGTPFPATLSATGCVDPDRPWEVLPALIPFEPSSPLWSDDLDKRRWLALPDDARLRADPEGDLQAPIGTVLLKEFADGPRRLETRLFVKHDGDTWGGYTYLWRDDQSDADLLSTGTSLPLAGSTWDVPSRPQCLECHNTASGRSLGLELAQLDHDLEYPLTGRTANQLLTLVAIGALAPPETTPEPLPPLDGAWVADVRVRAYLHTNCSPCHRPGGGIPAELDLRASTPLRQTNLCAAPTLGDLGVQGARVVAPGHPERSILSLRMHTRDEHQMPPLGTNVVDEVAVDVVDAWIRELEACP